MSEIKTQVEAILCNEALDKPTKVAQLRQLEADALAKQRGGTEGVRSDRADDGEELKTVERALLTLGETAVDQGAATL